MMTEEELASCTETEEISDIQKFNEQIKTLGPKPGEKRKWIYRGQKLEKNYETPGLKTSLERVLEKSPLKAPEAEAILLHEFQRKAHHYLPSLPEADDTLHWFSIMRHYGAPTRLLDWTYSPYIAAFNAIEEGEPGEVWAINTDIYSDARQFSQWKDQFKQYGTQKSRREINQLFFGQPVSGVVHLSPFVLDERLTIQQGTFLAPGNIEQSFVENLRHTPAGRFEPDHIRRFEIGSKKK